ncbi:hypothetical protein E3N88_24307 [Mikania micrantha]|uniref:S-protein homolog n=1 Tax=Mikania micrantha TaxID=192012 RepID=A0A5N6N1H7_9ASTR|nr:hypothetical protein E3N88_24307 [Mikania micrantha]
MSSKQLPEYFTIHGITYQIRVVNGFTSNSSLPLVIWCASVQEGDIGGRALQEGDDYTWDTRLSIWRRTPGYSCTIKWDGIRKKFEAFDEVSRCGSLRKCSWLVKEDGFYFSNDESNWGHEKPTPPDQQQSPPPRERRLVFENTTVSDYS